MTPPPIRYPLPTLVGVLILVVLAWRGRDWIASAGAPIRAGIDRVVSGPPIPSSTEPMRRAGPIVRKVLLLRDGVGATDVPGGALVETIGRRIFADVYDVWPTRGEPTHYRIGNRRPIGWVEAGDALPWDTRIVLSPAGGRLTLVPSPGAAAGEEVRVGPWPLPVLDWQGDHVLIADWDPTEPWSVVARTGWVGISDVGPGSFGILMNRFEVLDVLRVLIGPEQGRSGPLRVAALLGRIGDAEALGAGEVEEAYDALPDPIVSVPVSDVEPVADRLGRINDEWVPEVSWSGIGYRSIPIDAIPRP